MMNPSELPVAGYFRVSQVRDDMKAPELYRDEIDRYCAYKRLKLVEVFSDIPIRLQRSQGPAST